MKKIALAALTVLLAAGAASAQAGGTMMKSDKPGTDGAMMKADQAPPAGTMMKAADPARFADPMDSSAYNVKPFGKQVVAFSTEAAAQALAKLDHFIERDEHCERLPGGRELLGETRITAAVLRHK